MTSEAAPFTYLHKTNPNVSDNILMASLPQLCLSDQADFPIFFFYLILCQSKIARDVALFRSTQHEISEPNAAAEQRAILHHYLNGVRTATKLISARDDVPIVSGLDIALYNDRLAFSKNLYAEDAPIDYFVSLYKSCLEAFPGCFIDPFNNTYGFAYIQGVADVLLPISYAMTRIIRSTNAIPN